MRFFARFFFSSLSPLSASSAARTLSISRAPSGAGADDAPDDASSVVAEAAATTLLLGFLVVVARVVLTAAPSPLVAAGVRAPRCSCLAATAGAEVVAGVAEEEEEERDAAATMGLLAALRGTTAALPRESAAEETVRIEGSFGLGRGVFLWRKRTPGNGKDRG